MEELCNFLRARGFEFTPVLDGKIHRFSRGSSRKDNGWFIGFQNHAMQSGEVYIVAEFGDWKTSEIHKFATSSVKVSKPEMDIIAKRIDAARKEAAEAKAEKQAEVADKSARFFDYLKDSGPTEYTHTKGITNLTGTKRDDQRNLVIPMRDVDGKVWGYQRINQQGEKYFKTGQRVKGLFFLVGGELSEELEHLYIAEGWATCASIHAATNQCVATCFNSGNLAEVVKAIKGKFPQLRFTVCADNDEHGVGLEAAKRAAEVGQGEVLVPDELGDWNDMHMKYGLDFVAKSLEGAVDEGEDRGFVPLGFQDATHFFYCLDTKSIFATSTFTDVHLFNLAPRHYWEANYATEKGCDWQGAKNDLITMSKKIGKFDASYIRGDGVYNDAGRTVVNTGKELIVNGRKMRITRFKSRYFYLQTSARISVTDKPELSVEECSRIAEFTAQKLSYARGDVDNSLLLGWIMIARIAGALPVHPHIWITGGKGTGKSTLLESLVYPLLGCDGGKLYVQGGTTEAGIRQAIGASSKPLIMDEAEPTNKKSKELLESILELNRQAWSQTRGSVLKGSPTGQAVQYSVNYCALMSSIRVALSNDADQSRYSVIELKKPKTQFSELSKFLNTLTEEVGERLFKRAISRIDVLLKSYQVLYNVISHLYTPRVAQQTAMLMAGSYLWHSNEPISEERSRQVAIDRRFASMVNAEESVEDSQQCLNHLLTTKIRVGGDSHQSVEKTIESIINDDIDWQIKDLRNYGVRYLSTKKELQISESHSELKKIYEGTHWIRWHTSLKRIPGATESSSIRFSRQGSGNEVKQRSVNIPFSSY